MMLFVSSYAFRSPEKAALQEIGPRFTLKLRSLKKGVPVVEDISKPPPALDFANDEDDDPVQAPGDEEPKKERETDVKRAAGRTPNTNNDFEWVWKPELETTRRTFFL